VAGRGLKARRRAGCAVLGHRQEIRAESREHQLARSKREINLSLADLYSLTV